MFEGLVQLRSEERRPAWAGFFTLAAVMAGHGLLETARDALFLARIPASRLPFVYLGVALVTLVLGVLPGRGGSWSRSRGLAALLVACSGVTLGFWPLVAQPEPWALYALYLWSATSVMLVVARFWLMVSERFTVTQAKRIYAFIGAGSVLGAIAGTGLAGVLTLHFPARHLLLAAAGAFALASAGPAFLLESGRGTPAILDAPASERFFNRELASPYVLRLGALVLVAAITVTVVDFTFKSQVAAAVAPADLGAFFARFYLVLNFVSLGAQLLLVRPLVRSLSTTGSLAVLPLLLGGAGVAIAAGGGVIAAVGAKAGDALRHSLHRTAVELLYVPMTDRARTAAKSFAEVLGQRGGQALASIAILGAVALGAGDRSFGLAVAALAALWLVVVVGLRAHYLELFRTTLRESAQLPRVQHPELDLSSLEAVMAALNSRNDGEVRAALQVLAEERRTRIIPALILYHPSSEVVLEALEILVRSRRKDFLPIAERLLEHPSPEVRAAALRARTATEPDASLLVAHAGSPCPALRTTALVGLLALGKAEEGAFEALEAIAGGADAEAKIALASAIRFRPAARFEELLVLLSKDASVEVRRAALVAMAAAPSARYLSPLVKMLTERQLRSEARATLISLGDTALSFLSGALADESRPHAVRRHLPRTIMRFEPQKAATALLEQIQVEDDGVVRYKILRALGFLRANHPNLKLDRAVLTDLIDRTVSRTYRMLEWRWALESGRTADPRRDTPTGRLLTQLLRDKEAHAIERLFRLLGLAYAGENLLSIYRGLKSGRADVRASSRELCEHLLEPPLRDAVLGLIDDGSDAERLRAAGGYHQRRSPSYESVLAELLEAGGGSLRSITVYHIGELGLTALRPELEALDSADQPVLERVTRRALELLGPGPELQPKLAVT
jgi:ATP:ADP antiporter, AAA family